MHAMPWVNAAVWLPVGDLNEDGRVRFTPATPRAAAAAAAPDISEVEEPASPNLPRMLQAKWAELKGKLVVTQPWPSMARTVWGDPELAASEGWVGDLDKYRARYWSSFCTDDGEPVMALDINDIGRPWADGAFSVLGYAREELRLGLEGTLAFEQPLHASAHHGAPSPQVRARGAAPWARRDSRGGCRARGCNALGHQ